MQNEINYYTLPERCIISKFDANGIESNFELLYQGGKTRYVELDEQLLPVTEPVALEEVMLRSGRSNIDGT